MAILRDPLLTYQEALTRGNTSAKRNLVTLKLRVGTHLLLTQSSYLHPLLHFLVTRFGVGPVSKPMYCHLHLLLSTVNSSLSSCLYTANNRSEYVQTSKFISLPPLERVTIPTVYRYRRTK